MQQLQRALGEKKGENKVKGLSGPFLAPGKEQRGRPEAQGAGEKEKEVMTSSLEQWECAQQSGLG